MERRELEDGLYVRCPGCDKKLVEPHVPARSPYVIVRSHKSGKMHPPWCRLQITVFPVDARHPQGTYEAIELPWGVSMERALESASNARQP